MLKLRFLTIFLRGSIKVSGGVSFWKAECLVEKTPSSWVFMLERLASYSTDQGSRSVLMLFGLVTALNTPNVSPPGEKKASLCRPSPVLSSLM